MGNSRIMLEAQAVFKYYIYLADDDHQLEPWLKDLQTLGFQQARTGGLDLPALQPSKFIKELKQDKKRILVLECWGMETSLRELLTQLDQIQSRHLNQDLLLGQVTVVASSQLDQTDISSVLPLPTPPPKPQLISIEAGTMSRFTPCANQVYYLVQPQALDPATRRLFSQGMPLIEARYLELKMISRLLRERNQMVEQEHSDLDKQLSLIMHTHLVKDEEESKPAEELEEQIKALSSAYARLATDINLINEGRRRLEKGWHSFTQKLKQEKAFKISDYQLASLGQTFLDTIDNANGLCQTLIISRDSHQAAIDVVQSRIEILNSRINMATQEKIRELMELNTSIQKQGLAFQFAAGLIEFIVLAYYSHSLWKNLVYNAYHNIPSFFQLIAVLLFSGLTTYLTHLLAEYVQGHTHLKTRIIVTALPLLLLLLFIVLASIIFNGSGLN